MAGRNPAEAVQNFVDPLIDAIRCVTDAPLTVTGYHQRTEPHFVAFRWPQPVTLAGPGRLSLVIRHHYRVVAAPDPRGPYKVSTAGYDYALRDAQNREVLAFHWHPVRWGATSGTAFLFDGGGFLPPAQTTYTDTASLTDEALCYLLVALGGSPTSTDNFQGLSDFLCVYTAPATGVAATNVSIRLQQTAVARLRWVAPATGDYTGYRLTAHTFDGGAPQVVDLAADALTYNYMTNETATCFTLETLNGATVVGVAKRLCAVPGLFFLPTGAPNELQSSFDLINQTLESTGGARLFAPAPRLSP